MKNSSFSRSSPGRFIVDVLLWPSDCRKALLHYRRIFGKRPNFIFPKTFNEFLQHRSLIERKERWIQLADKLAVREFVAQRIGDQYLVPLLWSGESLSAAKNTKLEFPLVLKANHISGEVILAPDKESFDWEQASKRATGWLSSDYSLIAGEWQYRWIQPRLMIERMLQGENGMPPEDFKLFCFHGRVEIIQVDVDRFTNHTRSMRGRDFSLLPLSFCYPSNDRYIEAPACLAEMIELAEVLAEGESFVRVDFYIEHGRPVFGELTFTPEAGLGCFTPPEWDQKLGNWIQGSEMPRKAKGNMLTRTNSEARS